MKECQYCGKSLTDKNIARHRKNCKENPNKNKEEKP